MPRIPCPDCKSAKPNPGWQYCDRCQGWGDVDRNTTPRLCPNCHGEGRIVCKRCRGDGTIEE